MTLNASGPLSLGGATTGQSINLELGQAATATASINATNFRTLAGVASGQISISNFYGKSNSYGWVTYLGVSAASGAYIGRGSFVDSLSNYYWMYTSGGSGDAIGRLSSSGVLSTFALPFNNSNVTAYTSSTRSSGASVGMRDNSTGSIMLLGSTLNRVYPGTIGLSNFQVQDQAITSSSELVCAGLRNVGKFGGLPSIAFFNAAGTSATTYSFPNANVTARVLIRTDGTIIIIDKAASMVIRTFTSSFTPNNDYYNLPVTGLGNSEQFAATISSSNEIFVCTRNDSAAKSVVRINSSYTITHRAQFDNGHGRGFQTITTYGGFVYVVTGDLPLVWVTCLSASDLSNVWTNRFIFAASNLNVPSIYATAGGVFVTMTAESGNKTIVFRMPLTGMPSDSSVVVSGASATLAWSIAGLSISSQSVGATSTSSQTPTSVASTSVSPNATGSPVTPTATNTIIS